MITLIFFSFAFPLRIWIATYAPSVTEPVQNLVHPRKHVQNVAVKGRLSIRHNHFSELYRMCRHVQIVMEQVKLLKKNVLHVSEQDIHQARRKSELRFLLVSTMVRVSGFVKKESQV